LQLSLCFVVFWELLWLKLKVVSIYTSINKETLNKYILNTAICAEEFALVGPCRGLIPKWSYHQDTNECSKFSYSGCKGSQNNFDTKEQCEQSCKN